jgi:predicted nuclease of restriction endonuclease-like (RecB) superfamily
MKLGQLTDLISKTDTELTRQAGKSVNILLTIRNWLIGYRICEYEQHGEDRASYGEKLIPELAKTLKKNGVSGCSTTALKIYRQLYLIYPGIGQTLSGQFKYLINQSDTSIIQISPTVSDQAVLAGIVNDIPQVPADDLVKNIPFSSFVELLKVREPLKRSFYEVEFLRGQWSTRELRRQIVTLFYERSAYSTDKKKLSKLVQRKVESTNPKELIRDPYVFEFLNIKPHEALRENDLRDALLDKVQTFLLEMGKGFCFEARNKRILIGEKYHFIDIVLYNRVSKRSILVELKIDEAKHENIGQLNTYVSYYKKYEMHEGDNLPIGILLCTQKDEAMVELAQADMNNDLFVSNYQFNLPEIDKLKLFVQKSLHELKEIKSASNSQKNVSSEAE